MADHIPTPPTEQRENGGVENRLAATVVLIIAVFMAVLDMSIVNVALPSMMTEFGVDTSDIQWVITAYTLVVGTLVPITGFVSDRFGYKRVFMLALVLFTVGSFLCGLAWNNASMILFRIIQGLGGGALMPVSMAMIFRMFPPERRGTAMGFFGIAIMFAPAVGPTLSGYLTEYLNWRLIFYINVPIGILDLFLAMFLLKELAHGSRQRFDLWGFLTSTLGFSTLLYGLGIVPDKGWTDPEVIGFLSVAIVSLVVFVLIEWNIDQPMLDLKLIRNGAFFVSLAIVSITSIALFVPLFMIPLFLQNISGLSPIDTGLLLLPQALVTGLMMPIAGFLFDRIGARWPAVIGLCLTAYSLYLTHFLDVNTSHSTLVWWMVLRGIGVSLLMMPVTTSGMNAVPSEKVGQATAINNTFRQVSASFGIAWATLLLSHRQAYHAAVGAEQFSLFSPQANETLQQLQNMFSAMGQPLFQAKASALGLLMGQIHAHAMVQAMDDVFWVTMWITIATIVLAFFLKNGGNGAKRRSIMG
ncbi:DHA2 family efflux MFS transporter permease subunit [Polycladomyces subterraneus]|uniref:DHA2 family efflux MFS transporter permease subunit n=1 Tax=Polycladomyces subterraneus TaxID=1016997 RepID=A0ABT8IL86_9BACL|nr:DHA2 family efflux MFS transporter permease subunit [Polycladomyces subterraneus]MDN4593544.1 DHA2 family efflux MFS transporter permease subunit [Polycladomyces subterraneus]